MVIRIALSGKLRSGKTTVRELFQKEAEKRNVELINLPLATPIYNEAYSFYDRHGLIWTTKDRKLLEGIGEALNDKYPHGDKIVELYQDELNQRENQDIIIDDMRRTTQANFLKDKDFIVIRVECPDEIRKSRCLSGEWSEGAITDTELDDYSGFDFHINNDYDELNGQTLDFLRQDVSSILNTILLNGTIDD